MEWNDERVALLSKLWKQGLSASQTARQLGGVSRSAVIGKVHRLGLAARDLPAQPGARGGRPPSRWTATRTEAPPLLRAPVAKASRTVASVPVPLDIRPSATILTLGEHACRWPIGDPGEVGFGFCGAATTSHPSYCDGHANLGLRRKGRAVHRTRPLDRSDRMFASFQGFQ